MKRWLCAARLLPLLALGTGGCAAWFMNGAEPQPSAPKNYRARLSIGPCRASKTGETIDPPKTDYYLSVDERGPVLYEIEASGAGAAFRNAWADEFGQHFFGWVTSSHAWEFRFPRDASQKPERLVFVKGTYTVVIQGGSYRPVGEPYATCPLNEVLSSPARTFTPPS
jgi:hypothetical protein